MSANALAAAFALAGGIGIAFQAAVNSELGRRVGVTETALLSGVVTTLLLVVALVVLRRGLGGLGDLGRAPAWLWLGGIGGTIAVSAISFGPPRIGGLSTLAILLAGQLAAAFAIDTLGLLGTQRTPVDLSRVAGLALVAVGAALVLRR